MHFDAIARVPGDPILGLLEAYAQDTNPRKFDLGVGVYKDAQGLTPILRSVKLAEQRLVDEQRTKSYIGGHGDLRFGSLLNELVMGADSPLIAAQRVGATQTPGGTGALRLSADVIAHCLPGRGIWLSDPTYGITGNYEGFKAEKELKEAVYRVDPQSGKMDRITDEMDGPNGVCFSPDYKKLYVADTGSGREMRVWDVVDGKSLRNGKRFAQLSEPGSGTPTAADGMRCDTDGNVWAGARPGVQILAPSGEPIGMIRLPENCANVCFGGTRRNRLFMAASQSLYVVYVQATGAHIA